MAAPCVLVASCCGDFPPVDLVKELLQTATLPEGQLVIEDIVSYPWDIDTKYYTADIKLCTTSKRTIGDEAFAESVEAFVVYFDNNQQSSFDQVHSWLPFLNQIEPEVRLLVCKRSSSTDVIPRSDVQRWCIDNNFELVELDPDLDDLDEEDDFLESFGCERIKQALYAHSWSSLVMKDNPNIRSVYFQQLMKEEAEANREQENKIPESEHSKLEHSDDKNSAVSISQCDCDSTPDGKVEGNPIAPNTCESCEKQSSPDAEGGKLSEAMAKNTQSTSRPTTAKNTENDKDDMNKLLDGVMTPEEKILFDSLDDDDTTGESFEKLFSQLMNMKKKADHLPDDTRRDYAEKVALSFWKAIGGDEIDKSDTEDG